MEELPVQARFTRLAEQTTRWERGRTEQVRERCKVHALCDAIQVAVANRQHDKVNSLLQEMHSIVASALVRRRREVATRG
jgi:RNA 3'-terminal phosphate cyclase